VKCLLCLARVVQFWCEVLSLGSLLSQNVGVTIIDQCIIPIYRLVVSCQNVGGLNMANIDRLVVSSVRMLVVLPWCRCRTGGTVAHFLCRFFLHDFYFNCVKTK